MSDGGRSQRLTGLIRRSDAALEGIFNSPRNLYETINVEDVSDTDASRNTASCQDDECTEFTINSHPSSEHNSDSESPEVRSRYARYLPTPLRRQSPSNVLSGPTIDLTNVAPADGPPIPVEPPWPPANRHHGRHGAPLYMVDLTTGGESLPVGTRSIETRTNTAEQRDAAEERPAKRTRTMIPSDAYASVRVGRPEQSTMHNIEDDNPLDEGHGLAATLKKQREDLMKAQQERDSRPTSLSTLTCVICMDNPNDLTATSCGHLFCHACLMEALIAGENRVRQGQHTRSQCPVCRKHISRNRRGDTIPLELMMRRIATQPDALRA